MNLRQLLSERATEVLKPIDELHGRRLGDTELIDNIRTLLHSSDYVYNTTAHADAVLDRVIYIKKLLSERQGTVNIACTPEGNTALHIACKTVPARPSSMTENVWLSELNYKRIFRVRNDVVKMLVEAGANPFLANYSGATCIDVAPEGPPRESLVSFLHELRQQSEPCVLSVPPLDASRLMKRSQGDSGFAVFSHIAKHCVYYLYKGGIYLWDVEKDVEHVVYQPRESDPMITSLERKFAGYERRKSLAVTGQNVGGGKWTSKAIATDVNFNSRASFDAEEGEDILRKIALLEAKVALVGNFIITTGIDVARPGSVPREGVYEWIICNTGAVIGVKVNKEGVCLRHGRTSASPRRQSQVCGSAANYPQGMTIDTNIFQNCAIRFSRRGNASHICCAMDGLRRKLAYVVAVKRGSSALTRSGGGGKGNGADANFCGFPNEWNASHSHGSFVGSNSSQATTPARGSITNHSITAPPSHGCLSPATRRLDSGGGGGRVNFSTETLSGGKRVSFAQPTTPQEGDSGPFSATGTGYSFGGNNNSETSSTTSSFVIPSHQLGHSVPVVGGGGGGGGAFSRVFAPEEQGAIFRVCSLKPRPGAHPKESLEDLVDDLCNSHDDPFANGVIQYVDFKIPAHYGDAVCVTQCGDDIFILYCVRGVIVADATEAVGKPVASFHDITRLIHLPDDTFIRYGVSTAPQRFRPIKVSEYLKTRMFAVQTDELELLTLERRHDAAIVIEPMMRVPKDKISPHEYTPFFHGSRDELIIVYQSPKKTLVSSYDYNRRQFQNLCKLPKPSSLRFFPANKENREGQQELPLSVFAVGVDSPYLLRYNVTMHVMSVYSWDEVVQKSEAKKISFVPALFLREPKALMKTGKLVEMITKYASPAQVFTSMPCAWLIVECSLLQRLVKEGGFLARDKLQGFSFSPYVTITDNINAVIQNTFTKVATGAGGKIIAYQPPPFTFMPSEDAELDGDEVALLEEDYFASRPRHEGVWCAYFPELSDALRASLQLHRALSRDAPWGKEILTLNGAQEVLRPYQFKTEVERKHANVLADREETPYDERGPRVRTLVVEATTTTPTTQLLKMHRMATDTSGQFPIPGEPKYKPIEQDGVTVVPTRAMSVLDPILPIITVSMPQTRRLAPVEPIEGGAAGDAGRGTVFTPIEKQLTLITPFELRARLNE